MYLPTGTVSISAQIEAAVKACEAETARVGQDYYSALSASSPTAAKGPAAGKSPAPAKGKSTKEEPAAPAEVFHLEKCKSHYRACQCSRDEKAIDRWGLACSVSMFQGPRGWLSTPQLQTCIAPTMHAAACSQTCCLVLYI